MKPAKKTIRVRSSPSHMGALAQRSSESQSQSQSQGGPACPSWLYVSLWRTLMTSVMVLCGMLLTLHAPGAPAAAAREASLALSAAAARLGLRVRVSFGLGGPGAGTGYAPGYTTGGGGRPRTRMLLGEVAEALRLARDPQHVLETPGEGLAQGQGQGQAQGKALAQGQGQALREGEGKREGGGRGVGQLSPELQDLLQLRGPRSAKEAKEERRRQKLERQARKQRQQQLREERARRKEERRNRRNKAQPQPLPQPQSQSQTQSQSQSQAVTVALTGIAGKGSETPIQQSQPEPKISQVVPDPLSHESQQLTTPQARPQTLAGTASASHVVPVGAQSVGPSPGADWIPGSRLATREAVGGFRARLSCTSAEGRWVVDPTPRLLPWASDEGNFGHCDGRWTWNAGKVSHGAADGIFLKGLPAARWEVRPSLKFVWRANEHKCGQKAQMQEFDGRRVSRILLQGEGGKVPVQLPQQAGKADEAGLGKNERVILLVGDSMQHSFAFSLYDNFRMGVRNAEQEVVPLVPASLPCFVKGLAHRRMCWGAHFFANSQPGLKMVFARNDFLSLRTEAHWTRDGKDFELPWITTLKTLVGGNYEWEEGGKVLPPKKGTKEDLSSTRRSYRGNVLAPIVVLNRGMHYRNDSTFFPELKATMIAARAACPACILVYRNTPSGHKGCNGVDLPLRERSTTDELPFHWFEIGEQARNAATREIVESVGGVFLDVETMTSLRADGHTGKNRQGREDCTHYCAPGPVDFWTKLLFHALTDLLR